MGTPLSLHSDIFHAQRINHDTRIHDMNVVKMLCDLAIMGEVTGAIADTIMRYARLYEPSYTVCS